MAAVVLISRPTQAKIDTITLDASVRETHTMANTITDHNVEQGANISDHSRPDPDKLSMECIVSATPLLAGSSEQVTFNGQRFTSSSAQDDSRVKNAYDRLVALRASGALVVVVTSLRTYDDGKGGACMGIENITIPREVKDGNALRFTVQFKKIRIVKNRMTRVTVARDPRAGQKVKTGNQTMKFTEEELYGEQSALDKAYDAKGELGQTLGKIGSFFGLGG